MTFYFDKDWTKEFFDKAPVIDRYAPNFACPCPECNPPREEEVIDLSYEQRVTDLADELMRQFDALQVNDALQRANEIVQSAEQVEAMYLSIIDEEDLQ